MRSAQSRRHCLAIACILHVGVRWYCHHARLNDCLRSIVLLLRRVRARRCATPRSFNHNHEAEQDLVALLQTGRGKEYRAGRGGPRRIATRFARAQHECNTGVRAQQLQVMTCSRMHTINSFELNSLHIFDIDLVAPYNRSGLGDSPTKEIRPKRRFDPNM